MTPKDWLRITESILYNKNYTLHDLKGHNPKLVLPLDFPKEMKVIFTRVMKGESSVLFWIFPSEGFLRICFKDVLVKSLIF